MRTPRHVTAQLRRDAFALMKRCFTTLLTAALLTGLLNMVADTVDVLGDRAGRRAYNEVMDAFHKDNPHPSDAEIQAFQAYLQSDSVQISDELLPVWDHLADEYFILPDAELAQSGAELIWKIAVFALYLLFLPLGGLICVALFRALLAVLSGGECTPRMIFAWGHRSQTAVWLQYSMLLRLTLWGLLGMLAVNILSSGRTMVGTVIGMMILLALLAAAAFRYVLSPVILAADEGCRPAGACIKESSAAMLDFGFMAAIRVLWPGLLAGLLQAALSIAAGYVPALQIPSMVLDFFIGLAVSMFNSAALIVIYDHMRGRMKTADHPTFSAMHEERLREEVEAE